MDFIAIDFETANRYKNSVCSLGMVYVKNSKIIHKDYFLIKPPKFYFDPMNIRIHGIKPEDVEDKDPFPVVWQQIQADFEDALILAHYATFDIGVLKSILATYQLDAPTFNYGCTWHLSKKAYPRLHNHKLNTVSEALSIPLHHHHALSDAEACAKIAIHGFGQLGIDTMTLLKEKMPVGTFSTQ